jgi:uncharacterized membrane protein YphA (DoxX/SURF4 family)
MIVRRIARPLLSTIFVTGGIDAVRNPAPKVPVAEPVIDLVTDAAQPVAQRVAVAAGGVADQASDAVDATIAASPFEEEPVVDSVSSAARAATDSVHRVASGAPLPFENETYIRANGAVQVAAGVLLAFGRVPRLSSAVLAASLVPTTFAGHRFWEAEGAERERQKIQFAKNASLVGGLILAAVDTEGAPGLAWRARRARRDGRIVAAATGANVALAGRAAKADAKAAKRLAKANAKVAGKAGKLGVEKALDQASLAADRAAELSPKVQAAAGAAASRVSDGAAALAPRAEALGHRVADALPVGS